VHVITRISSRALESESDTFSRLLRTAAPPPPEIIDPRKSREKRIELRWPESNEDMTSVEFD